MRDKESRGGKGRETLFIIKSGDMMGDG